MAFCSLNTLVFLSFFFFFSSVFSDIPPLTPVTPISACNPTTDPAFCRSVLPLRGSQDLYSYSRFSIYKSLINANIFLNIVNLYLTSRSSLSLNAVRALEDCQLLAGLNIDFLSSAGTTLNSTSTLLDPQTDELQTLLSALLTNQQTCLDGIEAAVGDWRIKNGLSVPLQNGTKLYSISLSLFTRACGRNKQPKSRQAFTPSRIPKGRRLLFHEVDSSNLNGALPLKMSRSSRKLFESRTGRRILQSPNSVMVSSTVFVSQNGTGDFRTISDAVAAAPNKTDGSSGYFLIHVNAGEYLEYVTIPKYKRYVMIIGDGINRTVITGDHNNRDNYTTFNSATFAVVGQGFVAVNMTFKNTAGPSKHQAVAVRNGADLSTFYSCSFEGYQDTLYAHSLRQFYRECDVYGTVDFIFGNAAVVFQNCNIYSRLPMQGQSNTITAQGRTDPNQNTGISIQNCMLVAASDLKTDDGGTKTYLGRPWKEYSRTVIMQSFLDDLIDPSGWLPWNADFALSTLYYAEFNNTGVGSNTSSRVSWPGYHVIDSVEALNYTVTNLVLGDNWLPKTGVPYSSGLL